MKRVKSLKDKQTKVQEEEQQSQRKVGET